MMERFDLSNPTKLVEEIAERVFEVGDFPEVDIAEVLHHQRDAWRWTMDETLVVVDPLSVDENKITGGNLCFLVLDDGSIIRVAVSKVKYSGMPEDDMDDSVLDDGLIEFDDEFDSLGPEDNDALFGFDSIDSDSRDDDLAYGDGADEFEDRGLGDNSEIDYDELDAQALVLGDTAASATARLTSIEEALDSFVNVAAMVHLSFTIESAVTITAEVLTQK